MPDLSNTFVQRLLLLLLLLLLLPSSVNPYKRFY
jgi:hypothetical protein